MPAPVELVIEAGLRPHLAQSLRELWAFRGTVLAFAERDCRLKYKQAVLGVGWAVNPAAGVLEALRRVPPLGELADPGLLALTLARGLVLLLVAYRIFKRLERYFADAI